MDGRDQKEPDEGKEVPEAKEAKDDVLLEFAASKNSRDLLNHPFSRQRRVLEKIYEQLDTMFPQKVLLESLPKGLAQNYWTMVIPTVEAQILLQEYLENCKQEAKPSYYYNWQWQTIPNIK